MGKIKPLFAFIFVLPSFLLSACNELDKEVSIGESNIASEPSIVGKIKDVNNHSYKTVQIGNQVWMSENLNVSHFKNGESIIEAKNTEEFEKYSSEQNPAWRYPVFDPSFEPSLKPEFYGKLYNWRAVSDERGIAPEGWHVPTKNDWEVLIDFLGDSSAIKMEDTIAYYHEGTNESGFSGQPAGGGGFLMFYIGHSGMWWSSSEKDSEWASGFQLLTGYKNTRQIALHKTMGYSIRCVKD